MTERFPWLDHRTLAEVDETERLYKLGQKRRLTNSEWERLHGLLYRQEEANGLNLWKKA
jgi:hypothetical protein